MRCREKQRKPGRQKRSRPGSSQWGSWYSSRNTTPGEEWGRTSREVALGPGQSRGEEPRTVGQAWRGGCRRKWTLTWRRRHPDTSQAQKTGRLTRRQVQREPSPALQRVRGWGVTGRGHAEGALAAGGLEGRARRPGALDTGGKRALLSKEEGSTRVIN